jgi:hypothetical protein
VLACAHEPGAQAPLEGSPALSLAPLRFVAATVDKSPSLTSETCPETCPELGATS